MSILADWFRRAMGKDRATLIGRDNAVCREWQHAYPDVGMGPQLRKMSETHSGYDVLRDHYSGKAAVPISPSAQAKFDSVNQRIITAIAACQEQEQTPYAQACHARTKGWPQWKINFDLTAHERSIRTARGNRTRYARLRAEVVK